MSKKTYAAKLGAVRFACKEHPTDPPTVRCWNCRKPISLRYLSSPDGHGKGISAKW